MDSARQYELFRTYREGLLNDTLPFWFPTCIDSEYGGFLLARDRDGHLLDSDKGVWQQARFSWLLAALNNQVEKNEAWIEAAESGVSFLKQHGFDDDGRMFFHLTREGKPIRKRRYHFSETFYCIALAELALARSSDAYAAEAIEIFERYQAYLDAGPRPPKYTDIRKMCGLGAPMIDIATCQVLRRTIRYPHASTQIDRCIEKIEAFFVKDDIRCVMETVSENSDIIDHFDGRLLNPGHAIEAAWFILWEAKERGNDSHLLNLGTRMLDYMWERGWDRKYGGIYYFRDVYDRPVQEYWHDMKFWWPQNETIIATLLAYQLTGDRKYAIWHQQVHDWAYRHFPDRKHGEWFGYLHRDGRLSVPLKGNLWKGPFHLPRMQLVCSQILEEMRAAGAGFSTSSSKEINPDTKS